jgi:membrane associated rhomboid family serine protease
VLTFSPLRKRLGLLVRDFNDIFYALLVVFVLSLISILLIGSQPFLFGLFEATPRTPWGIVTGLFVHGSWDHFPNNTAALIVYALLFILTNAFLQKRDRRGRSRIFLWGIFLSAGVANLIWFSICQAPQCQTFGASPIVFAAGGVTFGFTLFNSANLLLINRVPMEKRAEIISPSALRNTLGINLGFGVAFLVNVYFLPVTFFDISPGVNWFTHRLGLGIGGLVVALEEILRQNSFFRSSLRGIR